jgi:diphthine-ammonia ligase
MRLASLFSGGKDSTYATYLMEQMGHEVDFLVGILPDNPDSWMFHTPNLHLLPLQAEAMGKRLVTARSDGGERDDLRALRKALMGLEVEGVITGALASDYQWDRINEVCEYMGLAVHSPLWRKGQRLLMEEMVAEMEAMIVGVSAEGLDHDWLGRRLNEATLEELEAVTGKYGINLSGEGGEYETLVLDSPLHLRPLLVSAWKEELARDGGRIRVTKARLGVRR